jgi:RNA polymerase sigma-70 factor (ECF subfamily)
VVVMRYEEELEPTEIARVLGWPLNTVKSRLHRGLEMLRDRLEK